MAPVSMAQRRAAAAEGPKVAAATIAKSGSDAASRGRSRSRSPARQPRASRAHGPQLRDWVLVRSGSRFWRDAVPALVSKVTKGLSEEDATVCLVLPNHLALRHGFGSQRPFLVLEGIGLRDVRPYTGGDQAWLRSVLLKAIKEHRGVAREAKEAKPALYAVPEPPTPIAQEEEEQRPEVEEEEEEEQRHEDEEEQPPDAEEEEQQPEVEEGAFSSSSACESAEAAPATEAALPSEVAPTTPLQSGRRRLLRLRPLARCESLPKEAAAAAAPEAAAAAAGEGKPPSAVAPSAATPAAAKAPLAPLAPPAPPAPGRHAALTAAVAQAFRSRGALELSLQELEEALGEAAGAEELSQTLQKLDAENKVFLSGDLVFLI